jgi:aminopeptidase N
LDDHTNYAPDAAQAGRRMLKNVALDLLAAGDQSMGRALAAQQCADAQNMTDRFAALSTLTQIACHEREQALAAFYHDWADDPLVLDKWFALQASIAEYGTLERVQKLRAAHADMMGNPNRLRALIGTFAMANPMVFHAPDGSGYALLAGIVSEVDQRNPQIAARLLSAFRSWRSLEPTRAALAQKALENVAARENLSNDVRDIVTRSLQ